MFVHYPSGGNPPYSCLPEINNWTFRDLCSWEAFQLILWYFCLRVSRNRQRQRRRGGKGSKEETEDTQQDSKEEAPSVIVHPPTELQEDKDGEDVLQRLIKAPSTNSSSDLTSPGEVVHLTFPGPKTPPPPLERVDSGRNVNVSVNITDFLKPKAASTKKSSASSSSEEESSEEGELCSSFETLFFSPAENGLDVHRGDLWACDRNEVISQWGK